MCAIAHPLAPRSVITLSDAAALRGPVMSAKIAFAAAIFAVTMGLLAIPQVTQAVPFDGSYAVSVAD
jgi:hypothetical protein